MNPSRLHLFTLLAAVAALAGTLLMAPTNVAGVAVRNEDFGLGAIDLHDLQRPVRTETAGRDRSARVGGKLCELLAITRAQPVRNGVV